MAPAPSPVPNPPSNPPSRVTKMPSKLRRKGAYRRKGAPSPPDLPFHQKPFYERLRLERLHGKRRARTGQFQPPVRPKKEPDAKAPSTEAKPLQGTAFQLPVRSKVQEDGVAPTAEASSSTSAELRYPIRSKMKGEGGIEGWKRIADAQVSIIEAFSVLLTCRIRPILTTRLGHTR